LDAIWKKSSHKSRETIALELSAKEAVLNSHPFGKFISSSCALSTFKRARSEWKQALDRDTKTREMFSDILGDKSKAQVKDAKVEFSPKKRSRAVKEEDVKAEVPAKKRPMADGEEVELSPQKKPKKPKAKSYLDDL
jgi:hypothetical protein